MFAKALHSLAKIGEDLYIDAQVDGLAVRSMNSSRSAFMSYLFAPAFFETYSPEIEPGFDRQSSEQDEDSKCRLSMKAMLMAFKSVNLLDKNVETCSIRISDRDYRVRIHFKCRFKVTKSYTIPFIETESLKANYDLEKLANRFTARSKTLTEACLNFLTNQEEVTMTVSSKQFLMKNYVDVNDKRIVRTELSMQPAEFEEYSIDQEGSVTYCLKELRAIINFADSVSVPISACFQQSGE